MAKKTTRKAKVPTIAQLRKREARRSVKSRKADESRQHSRVVSARDPKTGQWMKHPGRLDVRGIDTKRAKAKRRKAKRK